MCTTNKYRRYFEVGKIKFLTTSFNPGSCRASRNDIETNHRGFVVWSFDGAPDGCALLGGDWAHWNFHDNRHRHQEVRGCGQGGHQVRSHVIHTFEESFIYDQ